MSYTQVWNHMTNDVHDSIIVRDVDGAFVPFDPDNIDYQEYKKWVGKGNQPKPYNAPQAEEPIQTQKTTPKF